jgi:HD superfamily phosphodiesterase
MKTFVIDLLKNKISPFYYYHSYKHTLYVVEKAIEIATRENCTEKEIELVSTAALWHDTGFINTYNDHEEEGCRLARKYLPGYGFTNEDIGKICGMIMATSIPQSPKTRLEEIVADADLEYLGTPDAASKAERLFMEWKHLDDSWTRQKWNQTQINFLKNHHYFTRFCSENREPAKLTYLEKLVAGNQ